MAWAEIPVTSHEQKRNLVQIAKKREAEAKRVGTFNPNPDYGRERVYKAERVAYEAMKESRIEMTFEQLQTATNKIFADERVMELDPYPGENVIVELSCKDGANARVYQRRMRFGTTRNNFTLLHEIAHILTPSDKGHGKEFQIVECKLFDWFMGKELAKIMRFYLHIGR